MDANLREMGVGDLTVPKRMQAFGEAFYGRSAAYDLALAAGQEPLAQALSKNILNGERHRKCAAACRLYTRRRWRAWPGSTMRLIRSGSWRFPVAARERA